MINKRCEATVGRSTIDVVVEKKGPLSRSLVGFHSARHIKHRRCGLPTSSSDFQSRRRLCSPPFGLVWMCLDFLVSPSFPSVQRIQQKYGPKCSPSLDLNVSFCPSARATFAFNLAPCSALAAIPVSSWPFPHIWMGTQPSLG